MMGDVSSLCLRSLVLWGISRNTGCNTIRC